MRSLAYHSRARQGVDPCWRRLTAIIYEGRIRSLGRSGDVSAAGTTVIISAGCHAYSAVFVFTLPPLSAHGGTQAPTTCSSSTTPSRFHVFILNAVLQ